MKGWQDIIGILSIANLPKYFNNGCTSLLHVRVVPTLWLKCLTKRIKRPNDNYSSTCKMGIYTNMNTFISGKNPYTIGTYIRTSK